MRVAVVGAGPAGCAAAIELRARGIEVTLVSDAAHGVGEQLPPAATPLLRRLGLLPLTEQIPCVGVRAAWDSEDLQQQDFLFHPFGHGWLLDRGRFGEQLRRRAVEVGAELREPTRLLRLQRDRRWCLQLGDGDLRCDFVVDASGRRGAVARLLGVRRRRFDRQVALVGWLETEGEDVDATLTVETAADGWWYTARLPRRRRVAAWITPGRPDRGVWEARLRTTRHVSRLLRDYRLRESVVVRAADSSRLERSHGAAWMAVGDAAVSYDPLASRGIVGALQSGCEAAHLVDAPRQRRVEYQAALEEKFDLYLRRRAQFYAAS